MFLRAKPQVTSHIELIENAVFQTGANSDAKILIKGNEPAVEKPVKIGCK